MKKNISFIIIIIMVVVVVAVAVEMNEKKITARARQVSKLMQTWLNGVRVDSIFPSAHSFIHSFTHSYLLLLIYKK